MEISQELVDDFVGTAHANYRQVRKLLEKHPDLLNCSASWNETALQAAAHMGNREIAGFLLHEGAPLDICTAAMLGKADNVAAFLRENPMLANAQGAHGMSALYHAAITGEKAIAEQLIENGANVDGGGEGAAAALEGAIRFGQTALVEFLLARGADVNRPGYEGKTPIAIAREMRLTDLVRLLEK